MQWPSEMIVYILTYIFISFISATTESAEVVWGVLYLSLTVVDVPRNTAVIVAFLLALYQEHQLLPADAIVLHLACANLLVVGVCCLLETLASFPQP